MTASAATAALLPVGDVFLGDLDGPTDADWIRAELTAGAGYLVTVAVRDPDGDGPHAGAGDTMLEIYNERQELIASMDDQALVNGVLPMGGFHPQLGFTPASGGVHYFRVSSFISPNKDYSGGYRLELEETRPAPDPAPGAGAGPGGDPDGGTGGSAPVAMVNDGADAARLEVGGVHLGVLDGPADAAWITATLTGGTAYILAVASRDPDGGGPLSGAKDTKLEIYNGQDDLVASMDDQALVNGVLPMGGFHPRLSFTPGADGDYFFRVSSFISPGEDYSGGYQLEFAEAPPPPPAPDPDPDPDPAPDADPDTGGPTDDGDSDGPGDGGEQLWRTIIGERDNDPTYVLYSWEKSDSDCHYPQLTEAILHSVDFFGYWLQNEREVIGDAGFNGSETNILHLSVLISQTDLIYAGGKMTADGYLWYGHDEAATFNNRLYGGVQDDLIIGGYGDDELIGGSGSDYLFGDGLKMAVNGYPDYATAPAESVGHGNDRLIGGGQQDYLYGGGGNDYLDGGHACNILDGGPGNDYLRSGGTPALDGEHSYPSDHDVLIGGTGNDVFDVSDATQVTIRDFQDGVDRIKMGVATETNLQWDMDQIATETADGVTLQIWEERHSLTSDNSLLLLTDGTLTILGADLADLQFEVSGGDLFIV